MADAGSPGGGGQSTKIGGVERAAILLMSVGEQEAAEVLKHMGPKEVQRLGQAMTTLSNVTKDKVEHVLKDFATEVENQTSLGVGSDDYIRRMMVKALGEDKAGGLIDRILQGANARGLENLKWMEGRAVAELIRLEHPQIISIVLSYLDAEQSAEIIGYLPDNTRADILMRVATLDGIPPAALAELNEVLEKQFTGKSNVKSSGVGGVKAAANILNYLDSKIEQAAIGRIREVDETLATQVEELMFVFEDLAEVDDRGIQALMREVQSDTLLLALKGAGDGIKAKVFKNMSQRAAEMLKDDLEARGPVKLSEVTGAQKEIVSVARRMADAGQLALGGKGGEEYV